MNYTALWPTDTTFSVSTTKTNGELLSSTHKAIFDTTGVIVDGGGYTFDFPSTLTTALIVNNNCSVTLKNTLLRNMHVSHLSVGTGSALILGDNTTVSISHDQVLTMTLTFSGNSIFKGEKNIVDLASGTISVLSGGALKICNLTLTNVTSSSFSCQDNTASLIFENSSIQVPTLCNLQTGTFLVKGDVEITGGGTFAYTGSLTNSIDTYSCLAITNNTTLRHAPSNTNQKLFSFSNKTSRLALTNSTLDVTTTGLRLTNGTLFIDGGATITSAATVTAQGVFFGDGASSTNDLDIDIQPGAILNIASGFLTYDNKGG
jgi:hypothetical protein